MFKKKQTWCLLIPIRSSTNTAEKTAPALVALLRRGDLRTALAALYLCIVRNGRTHVFTTVLYILGGMRRGQDRRTSSLQTLYEVDG